MTRSPSPDIRENPGALTGSRGEFDRPLGEGVVTVGLGDSAGNGAADADIGVLSWESLGARAAGEGSIGRTCGSTSPPHAESAIRSTMIPTRSHAVLKLVGLFTSGRCGLCHSFIIVMSSNPHSHAAGPGLLLRELADREHVFDDLQVRIRAVREPYLAPLITGDDVVDGLVADNDLGL